ncbi:MAG: hypothetical protein ABL971_12685 [Vicinamibacterales bacterium]
MADSPSSNRGHRGFHRGRRGPDRRGSERTGDKGPDRGTERGSERRPKPGPQPTPQTENADVAQIMRDIRARVAQRHGINLTDQQIDELAARRLEAILDVRAVSPDLMDQLRRAAGTRSVNVPAVPDVPAYTFEAYTLYETPRGLLRGIRRLLNPLLKLFFNPEPLVMALNTQSRLNTEAAVRESERTERQGEWNALHYALLQRLVTEIARLSLETQHLGQQVESLSAKVDFNDRRVRAIEGGVHQSEVRTVAVAPPPPRQDLARQDPAGGGAGDQAQGGQGDSARRKRRRRRGRRPDGPEMQSDMPGAPGTRMATSMDDGDSGSNDGPNDGTGDGGDGGGYDGSDESGPGENRGAPPVRIEAAPPAVQDPQTIEPGPAPSGTPEER